jgi:hypothetical protein
VFERSRYQAKLKKLARAIASGSDSPVTIQDVIGGNPRRSASEKELFALIEGEPALQSVLAQHGATRQDLKRAHEGLLDCGGGQWVAGHYLAVSALAFPTTLDLVLRGTRGNRTRVGLVSELADYFKRH